MESALLEDTNPDKSIDDRFKLGCTLLHYYCPVRAIFYDLDEWSQTRGTRQHTRENFGCLSSTRFNRFTDGPSVLTQ
jgi:hypothetical protein